MFGKDDCMYIFATAVYAKLKEVILGRVFTRVENDSLYIEIRRIEGLIFKMSIDDISKKIINGYTAEYAAYEVLRKYKKFVLNKYFKEPRNKEDLV